MTSSVNYTDAPAHVDEALLVVDLLPMPAELARKTEKEKITIAIDKRSLDLFKEYAKKHDAKYQIMINDLVGAYADKFLKR